MSLLGKRYDQVFIEEKQTFGPHEEVVVPMPADDVEVIDEAATTVPDIEVVEGTDPALKKMLSESAISYQEMVEVLASQSGVSYEEAEKVAKDMILTRDLAEIDFMSKKLDQMTRPRVVPNRADKRARSKKSRKAQRNSR